MNFLGMGPLELLVVAALALVVFGPDKLPDLAREAGRLVSELRRAGGEVAAEFQRSFGDDGPGVARPDGPRPRRPPQGGNTPGTPDAQAEPPEAGPLPPY